MTDRFHTHAPGLPDAPAWLRIVIPAAVYPVIVLSIFIYEPFYHVLMRKEGVIEYLAVLVLLVGIGHGIALLARYRDRLPARWLVGWFAVCTLGAFLFAGEEISWGQHLGLWERDEVPEAIRAVNDQNETNLHNISNALDQGPTNLIVLGTFVGYVVIPLYLRRRRETMTPDNPGYWFWPTPAGLIAAVGVLAIPFPKRIYEWTTGVEPAATLRHSEVHEFYIALLMTIYLVSAYRRLREAARPAEVNASVEASSSAAT